MYFPSGVFSWWVDSLSQLSKQKLHPQFWQGIHSSEQLVFSTNQRTRLSAIKNSTLHDAIKSKNNKAWTQPPAIPPHATRHAPAVVSCQVWFTPLIQQHSALSLWFFLRTSKIVLFADLRRSKQSVASRKSLNFKFTIEAIRSWTERKALGTYLSLAFLFLQDHFAFRKKKIEHQRVSRLQARCCWRRRRHDFQHRRSSFIHRWIDKSTSQTTCILANIGKV